MKTHLFCILLALWSVACFGQDEKETLAKMDTTALKGKAFLNKAIVIQQLIEPLRTKEKDKDGATVLTLSPRYFADLSMMLERADLKDKPKPQEITTIQGRSRDQVTASNVIPIGVLNADAVFLTEKQANDNISAKSQNKKVDGSGYENLEIIAAGLLQGEAFQADVQFRISPSLVQTNINNPIERIEIDFQDGKGWRSYKMNEQLISYRFQAVGEVIISLRISTKRGQYISHCPFKVHLLERPKTFAKGRIEAPKVKTGRLAVNVSGGEYAIYTGCDQVFDRPIIIAEGFDAGQDVGIEEMYAKYHDYLYTFRNSGYDLVFVNYDDGRDYIQNNAQVLKSVINAVNAQKVGNNPLIVVGESMSGLVARWALREMENAGQAHRVSHLICFDTPHQGANVPVGLVELRRNLVSLTGWLTPLAYLFSPEVRAIDTPGAKQLLLRHYNTTRAPEFDILRQGLNNLGNGGYPSQCRNIALLNGSLSGNRQFNQAFTAGLSPGDKILDVNITGILCNAFLKVWTNNINQNTLVYNGLAFGICTMFPTFNSLNVTLPNNLDRLPGGFISANLGYGFPVYSTANPRFSFVPAFSSIDYRGLLNSDDDYTFPIRNNIINNVNQGLKNR